MSARDLNAFTVWASTSVHNLRYDPVGSLAVSAFVTQGYVAAWPILIALALFGANKVLGNWRTALVCVAGQVIGTLVSEGIVAYRVSRRAAAGVSDRFLIDVGPSYVVVSAIVVALLYGSWLARAAAALDLVLLVVVGDIFGGLSQLAVSAVGHVTAITIGVIGGTLLVWQLRRGTAKEEGLPGPAGPGPSPPDPPGLPDRADQVIRVRRGAVQPRRALDAIKSLQSIANQCPDQGGHRLSFGKCSLAGYRRG